jgi:hypothetical protein
VRQAAIDWAVRCFPFSDPRARFTALRLVGDTRVEVREAAKRALQPRLALRRMGGGAIGAAGGGDKVCALDGDWRLRCIGSIADLLHASMPDLRQHKHTGYHGFTHTRTPCPCQQRPWAAV